MTPLMFTLYFAAFSFCVCSASSKVEYYDYGDSYLEIYYENGDVYSDLDIDYDNYWFDNDLWDERLSFTTFDDTIYKVKCNIHYDMCLCRNRFNGAINQCKQSQSNAAARTVERYEKLLLDYEMHPLNHMINNHDLKVITHQSDQVFSYLHKFSGYHWTEPDKYGTAEEGPWPKAHLTIQQDVLCVLLWAARVPKREIVDDNGKKKWVDDWETTEHVINQFLATQDRAAAERIYTAHIGTNYPKNLNFYYKRDVPPVELSKRFLVVYPEILNKFKKNPGARFGNKCVHDIRNKDEAMWTYTETKVGEATREIGQPGTYNYKSSTIADIRDQTKNVYYKNWVMKQERTAITCYFK
eukprot:55601_1